MKHLSKSLAKLLASGLFVASASSFAATQLVEVDLGTNKNLKTWAADVIYQLNFKLNDRYSLSAETINTVNITEKGKSNLGVAHKTLRTILTDKSLWTIGSEKVTTNYRYVLPTTLTAQAQGLFGRVGFRNAVTPKWGDFALFMRLEALLYLQRNGYQTNPVDAANPVGNPLVGDILEISPGYDFAKGWNISYLFLLQTVLVGKDKGGTKTAVRHLINNEFELGWETPVKGLGLAANVSFNDDAALKNFGKLQWFKSDLLGLTVKAIYTF